MSMWVETDKFKSVQTIEYAHASVHNDILVIASDFDIDVDVASPKTYLHTAPANKETHVIFDVTLSESGVVRIYNNPTITANGTALPHVRLNQYSTKNIITTYADPTLSDIGTLIWIGYISAGTGGNAVGGVTRNGQEFVLPAGESLVVEITPATDNEQVGFAAEYYEVPAGVNKP